MKGITSTAFAIAVNDTFVLLVDAGAGVALSCKKHIQSIPNTIYLTHNHMDHTGDLPVILTSKLAEGTKTRILGNAEVLNIVRSHRLHDPSINVHTIADWIVPDKEGLIVIGEGLSIRPIKTRHSYVCYGFLLYFDGEEILGYGADSPFDEHLLSQVTRPSIAVIDARDDATFDHASFQEIQDFAKRVPNCSIWIVHYEKTDFVFEQPNVKLLLEGQKVALKK